MFILQTESLFSFLSVEKIYEVITNILCYGDYFGGVGGLALLQHEGCEFDSQQLSAHVFLCFVFSPH